MMKTQMKRVAVIGAAAAYTIASADDDMAIRLAGEIASNGTRRLGHQFVIGLERLNSATSEDFLDMYKWARAYVEASLINEKATLESVLELAEDRGRVGDYVEEMQATIEQVAEAHLNALEVHMGAVAAKLGVRPIELRMTDLERRADGMIPRQTALVKQDGYTSTPGTGWWNG